MEVFLGLADAKAAPPSSASGGGIWGGRWADARSCRAFYLICRRGGTLPAPPQAFGLAQHRKAQPVGGRRQRDVDPDQHAALPPDAAAHRAVGRGTTVDPTDLPTFEQIQVCLLHKNPRRKKGTIGRPPCRKAQ